MRSTHLFAMPALVSLLAAASAGCGGPSNSGSSEDIGTASAELSVLPFGVLCVSVTIGASTQTASYPFATPLALSFPAMQGGYAVSASAWNVACGATMPTPSYAAAPTSVYLVPGQRTSVPITLYPNTPPSATVTFVNPPVAIAAAMNGNYAVYADGSVRAWGAVVAGSRYFQPTIISLPGTFPGAVGIAGDLNYFCVLETTGVKCLGLNTGGQLGTTSTTYALLTGAPVSPTLPALGTSWKSLSISDDETTCAYNANAAAYCWGLNSNHQIAGSTAASVSAPVAEWSGSEVGGVTASYAATCYSDSTGSVICDGQLDSMSGTGMRPLAGSNRPFSSWANGLAGNCGIADDGTTWCYSEDANGELGNGTVNPSGFALAQVTGLTNATALAAAASSYCAIRADSSVVCWGKNDVGELGNGTEVNSSTPVQVPGLTGVVQLVAGYDHFCAMKSDGTVWCWGGNNNGQIGTGLYLTQYVPAQVL